MALNSLTTIDIFAHLPNLKHQSIDHLLPWQLSPEKLKTLFDALRSI